MKKNYDAKLVEKEAQDYWNTHKVFEAHEQSNKEKFYVLCMFPYPSGNIHMGHVRNYSIGDAIARYQIMCGKNVLQPMGWDAFGLPAENAAIKNKTHPADWTYNNIKNMKSQLKSLGYGYDWTKEITTCDPSYYKWEQWLFIKLYEKGLVYRKKSLVNWDPVDKTVLASEQVENGRGWRSGALIEKKEIYQWFLKITHYADELLEELENMSGWPEQIKTMQKNWIGRSEGLEITFKVPYLGINLEIYTTRPDTLMGVTYLAIAADHTIAKKVANSDLKIQSFIESCRAGKLSEAELSTQEKKGVFTGINALHPVSGEEIPIYITNFILMDYGSGAVMSVPAHDRRDWEFAVKMGLPIRQVIEPVTTNISQELDKGPIIEKGTLINSYQFDGLNFNESFEKILEYLYSKGLGRQKINYRLRDWGISRQRYWGSPIPIIYCEKCGTLPVPEKELPVTLPTDIKFEGNPHILSSLDNFNHVQCYKCGNKAVRETDTFDTFVESSWYYARFTCSDQQESLLDKRANYWLPVDLYIGGIEHAIMHLLYARFIHKVIRDLGFILPSEPFKKLLTQGMVLKDGRKMSKSKGNLVDPYDYVEKYGADALRLFIMFSAPPEQDLEWSHSGVSSAYRFINRLWKTIYHNVDRELIADGKLPSNLSEKQRALRMKLHETLNNVTQNFEKKYAFNNIIASVMELLNNFNNFNISNITDKIIAKEVLEHILIMLSPIIPHVTHHLWFELGHKNAIIRNSWPEVDEQALIKATLEIAVQVNGKLRAKMEVSADADDDTVKNKALQLKKIQQYIGDKEPKKIIVVPKRLVNIVI